MEHSEKMLLTSKENEEKLVNIILKIKPHSTQMSTSELIEFCKTLMDPNGSFDNFKHAQTLVQRSGLDKSLIANESVLAVYTTQSRPKKIIKRAAQEGGSIDWLM